MDPSAPRDLYLRTVSDVRAGVDLVRAPSLAPPAEPAPLRRFAYGAGLPLALLRAVLGDPAARRAYLRTTLTQSAITIALGLLLTLGSHRLERAFDGSDGIKVTFNRGLAFWSSLYVTLCVVEWIVIALSRQHGDQLSRTAALLGGVPPEDPAAVPRVRVDVRWMWRKLKRRIRGVRVFVCGLPLLGCATFVPLVGGYAYAALLAAWGAYWVVVFTAAKTAHGWTDASGVMRDAPGREPPPDPWFLRVLARLTRDVVGFRWWLPRGLVSLWRRLSIAIFPPCASAEEAPYELAGIAAVRALVFLPGVYVLMRPLFPVAAARAILVRRDPTGPASTAAAT